MMRSNSFSIGSLLMASMARSTTFWNDWMDCQRRSLRRLKKIRSDSSSDKLMIWKLITICYLVDSLCFATVL